MNLDVLTSSHLFSKTHQTTLDLNSNNIINNNNHNINNYVNDDHYGLSANSLIGSQIFQKLSEKFHSATNNNFYNNSTNSTNNLNSNPMNMIRNQIVLNSSNFDTDEIRKQMEYDKFMNEIWIGIVLTLIVISMVFCICSCFLYHQFRQWKRNYRQNMHQNQNDIESAKLNPDEDDPVPEYTLVSGLPSYEAALELLHKSPNSCLIVYPSIFNVFNTNEKDSQTVNSATTSITASITPTTTTTIATTQSSNSANATPAIVIKSLSSSSSSSSSTSSSDSSSNHPQYAIPSYEEATAFTNLKNHHTLS